MTKSITVERQQASNFAEKKYTVGLDLGDRWSWYCVLDERGEVVFERKVSTTPRALREVFGAMPHSRVALEAGTHSPWISRLMKKLGHEVIVAQASTAGTDSTSQCPGASGFDHDPGESRPGAGADGAGQCRAGFDEVLWGTVAGLQPAKYGRGEEQGIECGAADGIGAAAASDRVAPPTDTGL